jgi:hypothetical protein
MVTRRSCAWSNAKTYFRHWQVVAALVSESMPSASLTRLQFSGRCVSFGRNKRAYIFGRRDLDLGFLVEDDSSWSRDPWLDVGHQPHSNRERRRSSRPRISLGGESLEICNLFWLSVQLIERVEKFFLGTLFIPRS